MGLHTTNPPPTSPTHGPNRYKTLPARPKTPKSGHFSRAGRIFSRFQHHATEQGELSPASNTNPPLTRYKTLPATPTPGPNRYKTLPARPKTPKSGHFSRAGRIFSRFQHHATEQGELSPASNTNPPLTRYKTLPATPIPGLNRYKTLPATPTSRPIRYITLPATATPGPNRYKTLPARPKTPKSGHFSRAGRTFSRFQHQSTTHPVQNSPGNSRPLARPVQNSPHTPTSRLTRHKTLPATAAPGPNRYKTLPVRPKTPKSGHFKRAGRIFSRFQHHATEQGEFPPASNTNPPLTRYKTLPATATPGLNRYKTLPATPTPWPIRYKTLPARPKTPKFGHFSRAGRILSRFHHHATEQGEFSPVSNTTLVPISTQLTDWSPLSPGHQTNAPLSWALCGLSAAHHDVAPERAGTDRRLADWNWPRHTQASSEQLNPEQARLA